MKTLLTFLPLLLGTICFGQTPQCDLHTATSHYAAGVYVGNAQAGRFILIGTINVPTTCVTSKVSFYASHIDSVSLDDHYEMSLYCIDGDCNPLSRVLDTGLLTTGQFFPNCPTNDYLKGCVFNPKNGNYPFFAPYGVALETIPWVNGTVILPAGDYALAMGTDCQSSFYGGSGGGGNCGMGWGEDGNASETFQFKMFTGPWGYAKCLVWQNGLPDSLCVMPRDNPTDNAPHMIDFAIF